MYIDFGTITAGLLLLTLLFVAWFWNDSLRVRDHVIKSCKRLCNDLGVQFLDETVALSRLRLRRGENGGVQFTRRYTFEYSDSGTDRWPGYALITGMHINSVQLQRIDGVLILDTTGSHRVIPGSQLPLQPRGNRGFRLH